MHTNTETSPALVALRRVVRSVGDKIPTGFSGDRYWNITAKASDEFMDAFDACRASDTKANREHFRWCAARWCDAWDIAIKAWRDDNQN